MSRREHSDQAEDIVHNKVFSQLTPEQRYELCVKAAKKVCEECGYPGESKAIAIDLWIYLEEQGHIVKYPEYKGAIYKLLKWRARDNLRKRWNHDKNHFSINPEDPEELGLLVDNGASEKILEGIAASELKAKILQQAKRDQIRQVRGDQIIQRLLDGATQTDIAESLGCKQYQISRWLAGLRHRIR